jgi:DNA repair protein SbcC/Rad50
LQLRHLRVKNIRSYRSGTIELGPGTTLIAGDVGAGKTSLLYAIEMALFGTSQVDAAYLVRHGAPHSEVSVTFADDEHRHEIARKFRRVLRKGREVFEPEGISFSTDGAKTEYSATELRQRVIELLGFPDNPSPTSHSDLWRWAVYVPQERMREVLEGDAEERLETVRKALGVERYRLAAENADDLGADLRRSARARRSEADLLRHFDDDVVRATEAADALRVQRVTIERSIEGRVEAARSARAEVDALDAGVRAAQGDARELESLEREQSADAEALEVRARTRDARLSEIAQHRRTAEESRRAAEDGEVNRKELQQCDHRISEVRDRLDRLATDLQRLAAARADRDAALRQQATAEPALRHAMAERDSRRAALERALSTGPAHEPPAPTPETLDAIDAKLSGLRDREKTCVAAVTRAQTSSSELEELLRAGVCPRCGQPVLRAEFEPHRAEAERARTRDEAELEEVVGALHRAEDERRARERYERARDRWKEAEVERSHARSVLTSAEAVVSAAEGAAGQVTTSLTASEAALKRWAPVESEATRLREEVQRLGAEHERWAAAVDVAARAGEAARLADASAAALEKELPRLDGETAAIARRQSERAGRIDALAVKVRDAAPLAGQLATAQARARVREDEWEADRRALVRVDTQLDEALRRLAASEQGRAERARRIAEAVDLDAKAEWLARPFRETLLTMERKILAHAQASFERNFARYFAALLDDPALVASTDTTFTPGVRIEGEWTPAAALSGGERTALALAFRLALAQVVRSLGSLKLDTLLLDEPTEGFSPEQVLRMGELLEELGLPQVVLVSHEDELAAVADTVVRVRKVDGVSTFGPPPDSGRREVEGAPP